LNANTNVMKRTVFVIAALTLLICSCKKTWQCTCTQGGASTIITKAYKAEAASECAAWQVQVQDTIQQATCSI
jgi:hypothetical protein